MAPCGPRIDDLNSGAASATPIGAGDPDSASVGLLQQMLAGQGQTGLPNLLSADYGLFGPRTTAALQTFRVQQGLPAGAQIDAECMQTLVQASSPVAEESVARIQDSWKAAAQTRRQHFLTTTFLSDDPFVNSDSEPVAA